MEKKHSIHASFRELNQICKMINKKLEEEEEEKKKKKTTRIIEEEEEHQKNNKKNKKKTISLLCKLDHFVLT